MKKAVFLLIVQLGGCASNASQSSIEAVGDFFTNKDKYNHDSINLLQEFQNDDALLLYLSGGEYSCLDPESVKKYRSTSPKTIIKNEDDKNLKVVKKSIEIINNYSKTLQSLKGDSASSKDTTTSLGTSIKIFGNLVNAPFAGISGEIVTLANFANTVATNIRIHTLAVKMRDVLPIIEKELNDKYITSIIKNNNIAFNLWDSCAREKLYYIRDFSFETNKPLKSFGSRPSSVELAMMHEKYIFIKSKHSENPDLKASLKNISDLNKKLISRSLETNPTEIFDHLNDLIPALDKINKVAGADQPK